jgi:alkylation response protein AidB-like acyl-CoA dehydrogenase
VDFAEPEEHRALRAAVAGIAAKFGPRYYAERAGARRPCAELWQALGDAGFIGVNVPEEYGGGGGGLTELALVCEEIAAAGTPLLLLLVSAAISAEMISDFGTDEAARPGQRRRQGGVRDHRAGRGLEYPAHLHYSA